MWSEGKLSVEHLAGYSQEYFQLVRAVPELVGTIGGFVTDAPTKKVVAGIMEEESQHVELWAKFAGALGVPRETLMSYHGTPQTRRALSSLKSVTGESFCQGAAAMYAIESEQPKISRTKLDGLKAFYGMSADGEGTEYFREHEEADVRHAAVWRGLLQRKGAGKGELSLDAATTSLRVQNAILDSVMETYVGPNAC
jgi:pyrroloquinoline-quinone synthase